MNAFAIPTLYRHLDEMAPWNDRLQTLQCIAVADEAPDVRTFTFRSDNPTWFRYQPGQFVSLELPCPEGPLLRTYTLSSSPSRPHSIAVTVKAQPGSTGTRWMIDNIRPGSTIRAFGPAGSFSIHRHPAEKYLFISAGSGITPMMSMLRWLSDCAPWTDVAFVNCARRADEIIFRRELELLGSRMPGLSLGFLVEERTSREGWYGHVGRIDAVRLPMLAPEFREREVFCCGPEPFMAAVRSILASAGFDMTRYHQESFVAPIEELTAAPAIAPDATAQATPILFRLSGVEALCVPGETVLEAARAGGVRIAAACQFGLCGTCKVKATGPVDMKHNGGILDEEIADGYILACCSRPCGPVEIEA